MTRAAAIGTNIDHAVASPRSDAFALARHDVATGAGEIVVASVGTRPRRLFSGPGRFGRPSWSPDGRSLLVPWPAADQWLFLRTGRGDGGRPTAVARVARQFDPGAAHPGFPAFVEWCCPG